MVTNIQLANLLELITQNFMLFGRGILCSVYWQFYLYANGCISNCQISRIYIYIYMQSSRLYVNISLVKLFRKITKGIIFFLFERPISVGIGCPSYWREIPKLQYRDIVRELRLNKFPLNKVASTRVQRNLSVGKEKARCILCTYDVSIKTWICLFRYHIYMPSTSSPEFCGNMFETYASG